MEKAVLIRSVVGFADDFCRKILRDAVLYADSRNAKRIRVLDISHALQRNHQHTIGPHAAKRLEQRGRLKRKRFTRKPRKPRTSEQLMTLMTDHFQIDPKNFTIGTAKEAPFMNQEELQTMYNKLKEKQAAEKKKEKSVKGQKSKEKEKKSNRKGGEKSNREGSKKSTLPIYTEGGGEQEEGSEQEEVSGQDDSVPNAGNEQKGFGEAAKRMFANDSEDDDSEAKEQAEEAKEQAKKTKEQAKEDMKKLKTPKQIREYAILYFGTQDGNIIHHNDLKKGDGKHYPNKPGSKTALINNILKNFVPKPQEEE